MVAIVLRSEDALAFAYEDGFVYDSKAGFVDSPGGQTRGLVLATLESHSDRLVERPIDEGIVESQDITEEDANATPTGPSIDLLPVKPSALAEKSEPAVVKVEKVEPVEKPPVAKSVPAKTAPPEEEAFKVAPAKIPVVKKPAASEAGPAAVKVEKVEPAEKPELSPKIMPEPSPVPALKSPAKAVLKSQPKASPEVKPLPANAAVEVADEAAEELSNDEAGKYDGPIDVRVKRLYGFDARLSGTPLGWVDQIYVDDLNDEVYLLDKGSKRIVVTNIVGGYLFHFNYSLAGVKNPVAFTVDTLSGEIYLSDAKRIAIFDYRGEYQGDFDLSQMPGSKTVSIQSLRLVKGDDGDLLYIGDNRNRRIMVFTTGGKYVRTIGKDRWVGNNINGLSVNKDTVFWLDSTGFSVKSISFDGKERRSFGRLSSLLGGFSMPTTMTIDDINKRIIVVDANRMMVIFFDYEGNTLFEFGGPLLFTWPRAVAVDKKGRVFVSDNKGVIRVFNVIPLSPSGK